jgi:manganese/zinc/iron transport system substrate-binding protein
MKRYMNHIPRLFIMVLTMVFLLAGCSENEADSGKIRIVATTGMVGDAAAVIGGEFVDVISLMGPGVDPHLYKASAGDTRRLNQADMILFNGLHLESKMGEVLERITNKPVKAIAESIPENLLISDTEGAVDPHVWFDVDLWKIAAGAVYRELVDAYPQHEEGFSRNWEDFKTELDELQNFARQELAKIPEEKRVLITAHDAFGYFGKAYGFEVLGLQGISTVTEAGAGDVRELAEFIADREIPAIFIESSVPERNIIALREAVQQKGFDVEIGGELFSDAMGSAGTPEGTYLGMVRHNIETIVQGLTNE